MVNGDLEKYCKRAIENGATNVKLVCPGSVVTAPWVRLKCQFGCPQYGKSHCCPPNSPTEENTRSILDSYTRILLFHVQGVFINDVPKDDKRKKDYRAFVKMMIELEGELFKDGFYKAFVFLCGPCALCDKECTKLQGNFCRFGNLARPSMESCGIDVFQTARNNGFFIRTLKNRDEKQNRFCLMLVD